MGFSLQTRSALICGALALTAILGAACDHGIGRDVPRVESRIAPFDSATVQTLAIAKFDPETGQRWSARFHKNNGFWELESPPEGRTLLDRSVDSGFIDHLLSLLPTLVVGAAAPDGQLAALGLDHPRFAVDLSGDNGFSKHLEIGDVGPGGEGAYATRGTDQERSSAVIVRGSALQMLGMIHSFDVLRRRILLNFDADDVDEMEFWSGKKALFCAQRAGDDWTDKAGHKLPPTMGARLEGLTHLRIQAFIDNPSEAAPLRDRIEADPAYRAVFKDRQGHPTELKLKVLDGHTFARISSRPDGVFELAPEALRYWMVRP